MYVFCLPLHPGNVLNFSMLPHEKRTCRTGNLGMVEMASMDQPFYP